MSGGLRRQWRLLQGGAWFKRLAYQHRAADTAASTTVVARSPRDESVQLADVSRATCYLVSFLPFAAVAEILGEGNEVAPGLVA